VTSPTVVRSAARLSRELPAAKLTKQLAAKKDKMRSCRKPMAARDGNGNIIRSFAGLVRRNGHLISALVSLKRADIQLLRTASELLDDPTGSNCRAELKMEGRQMIPLNSVRNEMMRGRYEHTPSELGMFEARDRYRILTAAFGESREAF